MKEDEPEELEPLDSDSAISSRSLPAASFKSKGLKTGLKNSAIPSVILDSKLNVIWENKRYQELFTSETRRLPVNLVSDFSPFINTSRLSKIYKSVTDENTGFSYKGRLEKRHRDRLSIITNIIITPLFEQSDKKNIKPSFYTALFDDISAEHKAMLQNTFLSLLEASKLKDNDTGNHIERVGEYSKVISEKLFGKEEYPEVDREFIENILFLAPMHDVGKIGTPDDILNKQGPLDDREWMIMKEHTKNGAYILHAYPDPMAKQIAIFHHEKWDGSGYPAGIDHFDIPLAPRIVAIADVYDALRMRRSYKEPFTHEESVEIIKKDAGSHFDPALVDVFLKIENDFREIYNRLIDS